jgi:hypothetical protein
MTQLRDSQSSEARGEGPRWSGRQVRPAVHPAPDCSGGGLRRTGHADLKARARIWEALGYEWWPEALEGSK